MQSDGCRSCKLNPIEISINNVLIHFSNILDVEETLENIFLAPTYQFNYQSNNFKIDIINDKFIVDILDNESLILNDENDLCILGEKLCNILEEESKNQYLITYDNYEN